MTLREITALLVMLCVLPAVYLPMITVFCFARIREALHRHLLHVKSKRAIKEARRGDSGGLLRFLRLKWRRELAGSDDAYAVRLGRLCDALWLLLIPFEAAAVYVNHSAPDIKALADTEIPLICGILAWTAFCYTLLLTVFWFVMMILCIRDPDSQKKRREQTPHAGFSPAALWLEMGYILAALVCFFAGQYLFAGGLLLVNALHLFLALRADADHLHCMWQSLQHKPMTPGHHSEHSKELARKFAKTEMTGLLIIGAVIIAADLTARLLEMR